MESNTDVLPAHVEKFDLNQVHVSGSIQRIWASGADVLLRLALPESAGGKEADAPGNCITLRLPGGCVQGTPVSLMKGDRICLRGHLVDVPYREDGRQFLARARKTELLDDLPALAQITAERVSTEVVVEELVASSTTLENRVVLEGIVTRVWEVGRQRFARLAVYDCHTQMGERPGKRGRPWRRAHYVSIHFLDGQVGGRPAHLQVRDRVRVQGRLHERSYGETLGMFLLRAGQIGLLGGVPNADRVREVRVGRLAVYIQVDALLQFTK